MEKIDAVAKYLLMVLFNSKTLPCMEPPETILQLGHNFLFNGLLLAG
ncbi:MAG: hypothetical protein ACRD4C_11170 [Candidatus Acidiferrales bacterium]